MNLPHFDCAGCKSGPNLPASAKSVREVLEPLTGLAFDPAFWERAILPARIRAYRPEHLDLLCLSGDLRWVATSLGEPGDCATRDFPGDVAFMPRRAHPYANQAMVPPDYWSAAVYRGLVTQGAQYLDQVADRSGHSERDTLAALWRLAACGLAPNDSFAPLRLLSSDPDAGRAITGTPRAENGQLTDIDETGRGAAQARCGFARTSEVELSGRWSAVKTAPVAGDDGAFKSDQRGDASAFDEVRETAMLLLMRHGILTREMLALEPSPRSWQTLSFALRRMEYAGTIRRGYFVRALSGEQYALPEAL